MTESRDIRPPDSGDRPPVILVAEDDGPTAEMLEIMLQRAGYAVWLAKSGVIALEMMEEAPFPDVLLLDWMLPGMTGLDVCRKIRERFDALAMPILMVTAKIDSESISAAFEAGASDYITKPFLGAELRARVAAHLRLKQLSDDQLAMDEHLMEREKLATLGLLVSGVAHDLNNPLGGIYGYAQLLVEQETDPERLVALERIVSEVQRCNRIVADLLSFARRHTRERGPLNVGEVLTNTMALRERHLQARGVFARMEVSPTLPNVIADAHQLQQVFLNILVNAEHALREGGSTLRITAETTRRAGGEWLAVRFFNDGPPISPPTLSRIFDPFFTTKGKEGTGLGLAICRRIVREHGGDIEVQSGSDGTTFSLLLPGAEAVALVAKNRGHRLAS